jgi:hypothetical protein
LEGVALECTVAPSSGLRTSQGAGRCWSDRR